jgi:hypothetical protein
MNQAPITYKLNNGIVVLAKLYKGTPSPYTFANITQAKNRAATVGGVVIQCGRPFFVRMPA